MSEKVDSTVGSDPPPPYPVQQSPAQGTYPVQQSPAQGTYPVQNAGQPGVYPTNLPSQPGVYAPPLQQPTQHPGAFVSQGPGQPPVPIGTTVFVPQPGILPPDHPTKADHPVRLTCPTCQQNVETTIEREIGLFAWMIVGWLCLMGFALPLIWLGCCFIPFCIPKFKDVKHTCPNCKTHLGTYQIAK